MENSLKALLLAASLILTCTILGLGFQLYGAGREMFEDLEQQMKGSAEGIWKSEVLSYHDKRLYGSTVRFLVLKYKERNIRFGIRQEEGNDDVFYDPISQAFSEQLTDEILREVIDYDKQYLISVELDANENITGMWFVP